jgi:hypothetical protein
MQLLSRARHADSAIAELALSWAIPRLSPSEIAAAMKIPLPSEDTLLTASALGAAALGAQVSHSGSLGQGGAVIKRTKKRALSSAARAKAQLGHSGLSLALRRSAWRPRPRTT